MIIKKLCCFDFRNLQKTEFIPGGEMNVICGENAQGKTNIIEAIWLFTGAKSFRTNKDSSFIKFQKEKAKLELQFVNNGVLNDAFIEIKEHRQAYLNNTRLQSPSMLAGSFNAIIFSPNDLSLVKDGPAVRRRFLDIAIGQLYPSYIEVLKKYMRSVVQRNQIIKDFRYDSTLSAMLDVFEAEIAVNGKKIILYRKRYIEKIKEFVPEIYNGLSGGREILDIKYITCCNENLFEENLLKSRKEDMYKGVTSVGPHRDDIEFLINGVSAKNYGSQGQKRSVALSLKLSEAEVIKHITGEYPICLLDDVMSELDPERQNYILNHIKGWQSFLTCCDPSNTKNLRNGKLFTVRNGNLEE